MNRHYNTNGLATTAATTATAVPMTATAAATTELAAAWRRRLGGGSGYLRNLESVKRNEKCETSSSNSLISSTGGIPCVKDGMSEQSSSSSCPSRRPSERHDFIATDETSDCGHRVSTFHFVLF
ncbi:hypothetical protein TIFTF001_026982 [Ficus carica]|uniref:Uncharacterized protein n=1 Tax=Ficus carica TaxID=3494 RepID=A0AA88DMH0_FICCA|nr:hypothetical protein TIFTF001_026982 [Ficus carica]